MATFVWDTSWRPLSFTAWVEENQRLFSGPYSASPQVVDLGGDLWNFSMEMSDGTDQVVGAAIQAMLLRLRGALNVLSIPMFHRLVPQGTLRNGGVINVVNGSLAAVNVVNGSLAAVTVRSGDPVLAAPVAQRANTFVISTWAGRTLLEGDYAGLVNGQVVMNLVDRVADADGLFDVECTPRVRDDIAAGTVVTWNAPTVLYRIKTGTVPVTFRRGRYEVPTIEGVEVPANAL